MSGGKLRPHARRGQPVPESAVSLMILILGLRSVLELEVRQ